MPPLVCVTGGGGYIASWLIKLLLSRGYAVHATLRDPCDPKNAHLMRLDGAAANLQLFKADVLDHAALAAAVAGCEGVFHVASPVPANKVIDPETEVMIPAVKGTLNILQLWYCAAKTVAEETALEYAEKNGLNVITACPCIVFGPQLQPIVNTSSELLIYVIKGGPNALSDMLWHVVDVRDVADALLLVYEKPESSRRYLCAPNYITTRAMLELLKKTYPDYNYVKCNAGGDLINATITPFSSEKLRNLGWKPRELEETLLDSIEYYERGILQNVEGQTCRLPDLFRHFRAPGNDNESSMAVSMLLLAMVCMCHF